MSDKKDLIWRAYLVYLGFFIALIVVIVKIIMIQTEGKATLFTDKEEKIPKRAMPRFPRKGEILDRNYVPLVTSVSFYDIHMDPGVVDQEPPGLPRQHPRPPEGHGQQREAASRVGRLGGRR